jgi:hypothetical protein
VRKIGPYWKAVVGFIAPGAVVVGAAVESGAPLDGRLWISAAVAAVVTAAAVYGVPNADTD